MIFKLERESSSFTLFKEENLRTAEELNNIGPSSSSIIYRNASEHPPCDDSPISHLLPKGPRSRQIHCIHTYSK